MESQSPDAMMTDKKALALVTQQRYDFDRVSKIPMMPSSIYRFQLGEAAG